MSAAAKKESTYLDFLDGLLNEEVKAKHRTRVAMGIQIAHFRVASVSFDSERLSVLVENAGWEAEVVFEQIFGFRVLDELDLTRFWSHCSLKVGWLFEVTAGGWMAL